jgi:FlaA1/EpsC-like NDP-sugar epimerase
MISSSLGKKKRVLIYGAGALGVIVERVINSDIQGNYQIAGFLDNSKNLKGNAGITIYNPNVLTWNSNTVRC